MVALFCFATITLLGLSTAQARKTPPPCTGRPNSIIVSALEGKMHLCQQGKSKKIYAVALGTGGLGKRVQGDAKTPLGAYPLGKPRQSERFHIFIPVGYPTETQREMGFTGGDIGVHGPARQFKWLGAANTMTNWTEGCIAVGRDSEIREVADWVAKARPQYIQIISQ